MAVFFIEIGNEVFVEGDTITDAVNKGVSMGYTDGYLRKSVVSDPLDRVNTKDNTPAVIYYDFVKGDKIKITLKHPCLRRLLLCHPQQKLRCRFR